MRHSNRKHRRHFRRPRVNGRSGRNVAARAEGASRFARYIVVTTSSAHAQTLDETHSKDDGASANRARVYITF